MNSPARYSTGFARACALRSRLWSPLDRGLLLRAGVEPGGRVLSGDLSLVFPALVACYVAIERVYPDARPLTACLLRLHEIENVKLLWRAAVGGRTPPRACWRPLAPRGAVAYESSPMTPGALIRHLAGTDYGAVAEALMQSHHADLAAAEIGLDRWAWSGLLAEAMKLPPREAATARLVRLLVLEHDLDLLRRGSALGLDADLVAKATVVLSREYAPSHLARVAGWTAESGLLHAALPPRLSQALGEPRDWDEAVRSVRRLRVRECSRAFIGWPYRLAPPIAVLLLREAQAAATLSLAAARLLKSPPDAAVLSLALAASGLEG